jgi:hypothetical protein
VDVLRTTVPLDPTTFQGTNGFPFMLASLQDCLDFEAQMVW